MGWVGIFVPAWRPKGQRRFSTARDGHSDIYIYNMYIYGHDGRCSVAGKFTGTKSSRARFVIAILSSARAVKKIITKRDPGSPPPLHPPRFPRLVKSADYRSSVNFN